MISSLFTLPKFKTAATDKLVNAKVAMALTALVWLGVTAQDTLFGHFALTRMVMLGLALVSFGGVVLSFYEAVTRAGLRPWLSAVLYALAVQLLLVKTFFGYALFSRTAFLTIIGTLVLALILEITKVFTKKKAEEEPVVLTGVQ